MTASKEEKISRIFALRTAILKEKSRLGRLRRKGKDTTQQRMIVNSLVESHERLLNEVRSFKRV